MDKGSRTITIAAIALLSVIMIGEAFVLVASPNFSADVDDQGNWEISGKGNFAYDVVQIDSGEVTVSDKVVIYRDPDYGSVINDPLIEVGARKLDQEYYIQQLRYNLEYLGVKNVETVDAGRLAEIVKDPGYEKCCIVMTSGAFPETVYDGTAGSAVLKWISGGGSLYWVSMQIGRYIGHSDGSVTDAPSGYEQLFLGKTGCLNMMEQSGDRRAGAAYSDVSDNELRYALHLKNNNILYAVNASAMAGTDHLAAGYCETIDGQTYASTVFVRNGAGQVCIMAGDYSNHQRMDLQSLIASGITCTSSIVDWAHGTQKNRMSGQVESELPWTQLYVQVGGDFATFGKILRTS